VFFPKADSDDCKRFIITVIKNASINIYNKRKNENKIVSFTENLEEVISSEAVEPDVDSEDGAICTPLINSLPEKYQDVVECLVVRDYSVKETADKLGISEANVRKRFERAKKMMRQDYKEA
jgi:RNA polymerase sigma-70 factor (ECF subfamily)